MAWERERGPYRPMESSGVLFFRVVVMLSCLILVPLAAIFGSAFPELVKTQLVDRLKSLTGVESTSDSAARPPVAAIEAPQSTPSATDTARWNTAAPAPAWQPAVSPPPARQADYTAPANGQPASVVPASHTADHFTEIQQRLRDYGASHYALESIQGEGNNYRFQCTMAVSGSNSGQRFEAVDQDPLRAMASVLAQVEAWRSTNSGHQTNRDLYPRR